MCYLQQSHLQWKCWMTLNWIWEVPQHESCDLRMMKTHAKEKLELRGERMRKREDVNKKDGQREWGCWRVVCVCVCVCVRVCRQRTNSGILVYYFSLESRETGGVGRTSATNVMTAAWSLTRGWCLCVSMRVRVCTYILYSVRCQTYDSSLLQDDKQKLMRPYVSAQDPPATIWWGSCVCMKWTLLTWEEEESNRVLACLSWGLIQLLYFNYVSLKE